MAAITCLLLGPLVSAERPQGELQILGITFAEEPSGGPAGDPALIKEIYNLLHYLDGVPIRGIVNTTGEQYNQIHAQRLRALELYANMGRTGSALLLSGYTVLSAKLETDLMLQRLLREARRSPPDCPASRFYARLLHIYYRHIDYSGIVEHGFNKQIRFDTYLRRLSASEVLSLIPAEAPKPIWEDLHNQVDIRPTAANREFVRLLELNSPYRALLELLFVYHYRMDGVPRHIYTILGEKSELLVQFERYAAQDEANARIIERLRNDLITHIDQLFHHRYFTEVLILVDFYETLLPFQGVEAGKSIDEIDHMRLARYRTQIGEILHELRENRDTYPASLREDMMEFTYHVDN